LAHGGELARLLALHQLRAGIYLHADAPVGALGDQLGPAVGRQAPGQRRGHHGRDAVFFLVVLREGRPCGERHRGSGKDGMRRSHCLSSTVSIVFAASVTSSRTTATIRASLILTSSSSAGA